MNEQLTLITVITVHCFACPHGVACTTPDQAHDAMEQHYRDAHGPLIARLAGSIR